MDVETSVKRLRRRLRDLVEDSDVPRRQIDARLGHAPGYLSQLLAGTIDLKYRHVMAILEAIDLPPHRFFEEVYPLPEPKLPSEPSTALTAALQVNPDVVGVYGLGIETVRELRHRLESCEAALFAAFPGDEAAGEEP